MNDDPVNLRSLLPLVMPYVPRCPEQVACFHLRLAAIELCERARVWRHFTQMDVAENHFEITDIPTYGVVHAIERVRMKGASQDLTPIAATDVDLENYQGYLLSDDMDFTTGDDAPPQAPPVYFAQHAPGKLTLIPFSTGVVTISLFLKPYVDRKTFAANAGGQIEDSYDRVPGSVVGLYGPTLAAGALARLLIQTKMEWADPGLAQVKAAEAERGITKAMSASLKGQQRAPVRTKTHWF